MPKGYHCLTCNKEYQSSSGLWKHRQAFPDHSTENKRPNVTADQAVTDFLNAGNEGKLYFHILKRLLSSQTKTNCENRRAYIGGKQLKEDGSLQLA